MNNLFDLGPDWSGEWVVRRCDATQTAREWLANYHYLGTLAGPGSRNYGIFCPDLLACVVFALPNNKWGMANRYGLEQWVGNIEIARVATHPDAPRFTTSQAVSAACRTLHRDIGATWVFAYADPAYGHHGGIYQALNAVYVGLSQPVKTYMMDGLPLHPRSMVSRYGSHSEKMKDQLRREGHTFTERELPGKHTYILPIATPAVNRQIRRHLKQHALPYPKRAEGVGETKPVYQRESVGAMPTLRSNF